MSASSLTVAPAATAVSALILAAQEFSQGKRVKKVGQTTKRIFVFNIARLIGSLTLFGIAVGSPLLRTSNLNNVLLAGVFVSEINPTLFHRLKIENSYTRPFSPSSFSAPKVHGH